MTTPTIKTAEVVVVYSQSINEKNGTRSNATPIANSAIKTRPENQIWESVDRP
jgi:hypothetical protein